MATRPLGFKNTNLWAFNGACWSIITWHTTVFQFSPKEWSCCSKTATTKNIDISLTTALTETKAYLKIICFNSKRQFCASWSPYPPIILVVPINRCNVRMHPNVFTSSPEIQVRHTGLSHILCSFKWQEPQDKSDKRGMNVQAAWRRLTFWRQ